MHRFTNRGKCFGLRQIYQQHWSFQYPGFAAAAWFELGNTFEGKCILSQWLLLLLPP
jgi:hypothetical protein